MLYINGAIQPWVVGAGDTTVGTETIGGNVYDKKAAVNGTDYGIAVQITQPTAIAYWMVNTLNLAVVTWEYSWDVTDPTQPVAGGTWQKLDIKYLAAYEGNNYAPVTAGEFVQCTNGWCVGDQGTTGTEADILGSGPTQTTCPVPSDPLDTFVSYGMAQSLNFTQKQQVLNNIGVLTDVRNNGLTVFSFVVGADITVTNNAEFNIFNAVNGMSSSNGVLTISGDSWDRMTLFDNDYIKPDAYQHTVEPFMPIETDVFCRIPTSLGGAVARGIIVEIRRRTAASPTIALPIPNREVELLTNTAVETATLQRLPTRSAGSTDNYYTYGYTLFLVNTSGTSVVIPEGEVIHG